MFVPVSLIDPLQNFDLAICLFQSRLAPLDLVPARRFLLLQFLQVISHHLFEALELYQPLHIQLAIRMVGLGVALQLL